jgi:uncharacterized membrane protein required for colicin V production
MKDIDFLILTVIVSFCFVAFSFGLIKSIRSGNKD